MGSPKPFHWAGLEGLNPPNSWDYGMSQAKYSNFFKKSGEAWTSSIDT
jgi:hypothetical protein